MFDSMNCYHINASVEVTHFQSISALFDKAEDSFYILFVKAPFFYTLNCEVKQVHIFRIHQQDMHDKYNRTFNFLIYSF